MFALVEALILLGAIATLSYMLFVLLDSSGRRGPATAVDTAGARWEAAHQGESGNTRVVVRKVVPESGVVVDEHLVEVIRDDAPDFDARFLEAMARARARAALLQSEEE
jgi:hypothetical protein